MQIEIFSLCDAATGDSGKVNILGAFDTIFSKQAPVVHSQCAIVLRVRFKISEGEDHEVTVNFINEDGKAVIPPAKGRIKLQFSENQTSVSKNLIFNIQGLNLKDFGEYAVDLTIDKRNEASLPLYVKPIHKK